MSSTTVKVTAVATIDTRHVAYLASDDGLTQLSVQYTQTEGVKVPAEGDVLTLTLEPAQPATPADVEPEQQQGSGNL